MIARFGPESALLVVDAQKGVNVLTHWGGPTGRRNNPRAEERIGKLLSRWRMAGLPVFFTAHDSREAASPLKLGLDTGAFLPGLEPLARETVLRKDVNSAFVGTPLEIELRRRRIHRLVVVGFFTNFCIETTVRMANNLGFDTYLGHDACATTNRIGIDGEDFEAETVHAMSVANMHREFCTALPTETLLELIESSVSEVSRQQGNE
jgi:nicotinamidase-related amidase